jgi:hypothetical protein
VCDIPVAKPDTLMNITIQTKGSVDDAVSIDIHAVVCADIMTHGPSSMCDRIAFGISHMKKKVLVCVGCLEYQNYALI